MSDQGGLRDLLGLTDEYLLASVLNQFKVKHPHSGETCLDWDLGLVLHTAHFAPLEPLTKVPMWAVTFKTVFLTALATAKHWSKLHASLIIFDIQKTTPVSL